MPNDAAALIKTLRQHLDKFEFPEAARVTERTIAAIDQGDAEFSQDQRKTILGALRGARQFDLLAALAQALMRNGHDDPGSPLFDPLVRRQYAQSLIENGQINAAIDTLRTGLNLIASVPADAYAGHDRERREMQGLLGRAHKQIYMDSAAARTGHRPAAGPLQASLMWYDAAYAGGSPIADHWPRVNMLAMTARAEWDNVPTSVSNRSVDMAKSTIAALLPVAERATANQPADPWMLASLGEAYVALGEWKDAAKWYAAYADGAYVDAFQIASSVRQLIEVWRIDPDGHDGGASLVQMLRVRLADKPGGGIILSDNSQLLLDRADGLVPQSILGADWPVKLKSLRTGIARAHPVAAVHEAGEAHASGTAFLIRGGDLHHPWGDEVVAVTAAHVASRLNGSIQPRHVRLQFEEYRRGGSRQFACADEPLFESRELDACILRVRGLPSDFVPAPVRDFGDIPASIEGFSDAQRGCSIIGHPEGLELSVSLANSRLIDTGFKRSDRPHDIFLRYTTPTLGGNSGSPVYDKQWNLIGVHQAGIAEGRKRTGIEPLSKRPGKRYVANEGVSLKSIAAEVARTTRGATVTVTLPPASSRSATPTTLEALAAAVADPTTPDAAISTWFAEPDVAVLLDPEAAPADNNGLVPQARRDVSQLLTYTAAVVLSKAFRQRRNGNFRAALRDPARTQLTFVSEGDSWFQFPLPRPKDVIDHLSLTYPIHCRAIAGMEVGKISADAQDFFAAVRDLKPDGVLLSGGGNDLLGDGQVVRYVKDFEKGLPAAGYLTERLDRTIADLLDEFRELIKGAIERKGDLKFFVHGYDRTFPKNKGKWLRRPLFDQRGIESMKLQTEIVAAIVNRFNAALADFAAQRPGIIHHVDCRGAVGPTTEWYDELHPSTDGFGRVAERFDHTIRSAFKDHPAFTGKLSRLDR